MSDAITTPITVRQKALHINSFKSIYGTIAEIGAGQETARWFFRTRGASSTLAKSMSAYDMDFSDDIYGKEKSGRYVCESRLKKMLKHEFDLLTKRLPKEKAKDRTFFAFANTVAARSQTTGEKGAGWIGVRWQPEPLSEPNEIRLHVKLMDKRNLLQQEALGIIGVNLIFNAFYWGKNPEKIVSHLLEDIERKRIVVDYIWLEGPSYKKIDNRKLNLLLVRNKFTSGVTFDSSGQPIQPTELLFHKQIINFRSSYRPITRAHIELMECAIQKIHGTQNTLPMAEIYLPLNEVENLDIKDLILRLDMLGKLGWATLVTTVDEYYRLHDFYESNQVEKVNYLMEAPAIAQFMTEKNETGLRGGLLEELGKLFRNSACVLACPTIIDGKVTDAESYEPPKKLSSLYNFLLENNYIKGTPCFNEDLLTIKEKKIVESLNAGTEDWKNWVPEDLVDFIAEKKPFI